MFHTLQRVCARQSIITEAVNAAIFSFHQHSGPLKNAATKRGKY
jgi:hypothetical protein